MPMSALDLGMASLGFRRIGRGYSLRPHSWQHQGSASDHVEEPGRVKLLAGHLEALPAFLLVSLRAPECSNAFCNLADRSSCES